MCSSRDVKRMSEDAWFCKSDDTEKDWFASYYYNTEEYQNINSNIYLGSKKLSILKR